MPSLRPLACWDCCSESRRRHGTLLCVVSVKERSLRQADHSSRGVLPIVVRRYVWSRNFKTEEAMARVRQQRQREKENSSISFTKYAVAWLPHTFSDFDNCDDHCLGLQIIVDILFNHWVVLAHVVRHIINTNWLFLRQITLSACLTYESLNWIYLLGFHT
jgi:hypothetical protein